MRELVSNTAASYEAQVKGQEVLTKAEIIKQYGSKLDESPSVYCGTYGKYNGGSLDGAWLDLTKFKDYDEFMDICRQLHADEDDPELMYQDYANFPHMWYCESCMCEETFDKIIEFANLNDDEREAYGDYLRWSSNEDMDKFREANMGKWESEKDFAEHLIDESYNLDAIMGNLSRYFDYKKFADDLFLDDYIYSENGYVFLSCIVRQK